MRTHEPLGRTPLGLLLLAGCVLVLVAAAVPAAGAGAAGRQQAPARPSVTGLSPRAGNGASTVTVATLHKGRSPRVYFGSRRAIVVSVSSGRIVVTAPAHGPGTVHVRVRTGAGASAATTDNTFAYISAPAVRHWTEGDVIDPQGGASGISCPRLNFCMGIDLHGDAFAYAGLWETPVFIDHRGGALDAVSCSSRKFCAAVDDLGYSYFYRDGGWGTAHRASTRKLVAISCPSRHFCLAADSAGQVVRYRDGRWHTAHRITPNASSTLSSVACPTELTCFASGTTGNFQGRPLAYRQHGTGAWHRLAPRGSYSDHLRTAIQCPHPSTCVLMQGEQFDSGRFAVQYLDHGVWSEEQTGSGTSSMHFSCPSMRFCLTTEFGPDVSAFNPSGVAPADIPESLNFDSPVVVSCPSAARCVVLADEEAFVGTP